MNILIKDGKTINRETFQHICETEEDLNNIPKHQINFGSLAYVITTKKLYIADSERKWMVI
jgi:hypothetical protein